MKNSYNNFLCPHDVYDDKKFKSMPLSAQILYTHLCRRVNRLEEDKKFYRSLFELTLDTGMSRHGVSNAKQILIRNGYIEVERRYSPVTKGRIEDFFIMKGFKFKD